MHDTSPFAMHRACPASRRAGETLRALTLLTLAVVALALARAASADPSPPGGGAGTLLLGSPESGEAALLLDTRFALDVQGLLAELTLVQTFRNASGRWLDGTYLFPLPSEAAVRGLAVSVGSRVVTGRVLEREDARERFADARAAGQLAGLVEQRRPNLFSARVASIAPGAEVRVTLDVLLAVAVRDERLSLTLPTTLTPRYANAHAPDAAAVDGPILPARAIRGPRFTLDARIHPLADPSLATSGTHRLDVEGERLVLRDAPMDRDLVVEWPFPAGAAPSAAAFVARHRGERYVQLFMAPPTAVASAVTARELVLVIDTSGSMAGEPMAAARAAAQSALDGLRPGDAFDLIAFDDETRALSDGPRPATARNLAAARRFVRRLAADGGTEMAPALERALVGGAVERPDPLADETTARVVGRRADGSVDGGADRVGDRGGDRNAGNAPAAAGAVGTDAPRLRQVVFLTDGSIADEDRLLRLIRRDLGGARLFTVGIGSAPNAWFLDKAAEVGRGTALSIRDVDDVQDAVSALLGRLERPVLTDIEVQFPDGGAERYPARVPDLYADAPLTIVARLEGGGREAIVTGWRGEERFHRRLSLPTADATTSAPRSSDTLDAVSTGARPEATRVSPPALAMHWARAKVTALLDEQRESADPERHRATITALALDVGLVTPYTSFVAVEATPMRPLGAPHAEADVANLLPAGNEMTSFALPRGAAGIDTLGWLGLASGSLGLLLLWASRRLACTARATRGRLA